MEYDLNKMKKLKIYSSFWFYFSSNSVQKTDEKIHFMFWNNVQYEKVI